MLSNQTAIAALELAHNRIFELEAQLATAADYDQEHIHRLSTEIQNLQGEVDYYKNQAKPATYQQWIDLSWNQQTAMRIVCEKWAPNFIGQKIPFIKSVRAAFPNIGLATAKYIVEEYYLTTPPTE